MASCNGCGKSMPSGESGRLCTLCIAKMVNHAHGDYNEPDDPAVKLFNEKLAEMESGKKPAQGGCAVVALALAAVPAALIAAGVVLARGVG